MTDGFIMPAILPDTVGCEKNRGIVCRPNLVSRSDDNRATIEERFREYDEKTKPLLDFFASRGSLRTFKVSKGIADIDELCKLIEES
jgi:adenylate kinase